MMIRLLMICWLRCRGADESIDDFGIRLAGLRDAAMEEYQKSLESKPD